MQQYVDRLKKIRGIIINSDFREEQIAQTIYYDYLTMDFDKYNELISDLNNEENIEVKGFFDENVSKEYISMNKVDEKLIEDNYQSFKESDFKGRGRKSFINSTYTGGYVRDIFEYEDNVIKKIIIQMYEEYSTFGIKSKEEAEKGFPPLEYDENVKGMAVKNYFDDDGVTFEISFDFEEGNLEEFKEEYSDLMITSEEQLYMTYIYPIFLMSEREEE